MSELSLYEWQEQNVQRALAAPGRRWLFNDEMGLGKTPQGIVAARRSGAKRILVATQALIRKHWAVDFARFWPDHPKLGTIFAGLGNNSLSKKKKAQLEEAKAADIVVVSHNLLPQIAEMRRQWDAVLLDESHLFQRPSSGWSKAARQIVRENPRSSVYAMTATCMPNTPSDLWNLSDIVCPGRFGLPSKAGKINHNFGMRYTNAKNNGWGWAYTGVNEMFQEELRYRLAQWSSRVTQDDVADKYPDLLPAMAVQMLEGEPGWDPHIMARQWAEDALTTTPHVCILTHLRKSAREIAALWPDQEASKVTLITGDEPAEKRREMLDKLKEQDSSILVATMHSVARGVSLTWYKRSLLAELYWRPETLEQVLGRFCRLGATKVSAMLDVLVIPGTIGERIAERVLEKVEAINQLAREGRSAGMLRNALAARGDDDFLDGIRAAAASRVEGDYGVISEDDDEAIEHDGGAL